MSTTHYTLVARPWLTSTTHYTLVAWPRLTSTTHYTLVARPWLTSTTHYTLIAWPRLTSTMHYTRSPVTTPHIYNTLHTHSLATTHVYNTLQHSSDKLRTELCLTSCKTFRDLPLFLGLMPSHDLFNEPIKLLWVVKFKRSPMSVELLQFL